MRVSTEDLILFVLYLKNDKEFNFTFDCLQTFNIFKYALTYAPIITAPDWTQPFELMCDASDYAVGAVLSQRKEKMVHPNYYASKTLFEVEMVWSFHNLTCFPT